MASSSSKGTSKRQRDNVPEASPKKLNQSRSGDLSEISNVHVVSDQEFARVLMKLHHNDIPCKPVAYAATKVNFDRSIPVEPWDREGKRPWDTNHGVPPEFKDNPGDWHDNVAGPLWRTIMLIQDKEDLRSKNITGLINMFAQGATEGKLVCMIEAGRFIARGCYTPMEENSKAEIITSDLDFVWTIAQDATRIDGRKGHAHWVGILHMRSERIIMIFDSCPSDDRCRRMLRLYRSGWEQAGLDNPPVRVARVKMPKQNLGWTCGYWMVYVFFVLVRHPRLWGQPVTDEQLIANLEETIRGYLGLNDSGHDKDIPKGFWPDKRPSPILEDLPNLAASPTSDQDARIPHSSRPSPEDRPQYDLKAEYVPRPPIGDQRAQAMLEGTYETPYRWVGDSYKTAGRRPEPYFVPGWPGWKKYKESIGKPEPEDKVQKDRERALQREDLARRRGRSPELRMLEDKPRRRKKD